MARRESSIVMVGKRRERKNSDIERKNRSSSVAIEILQDEKGRVKPSPDIETIRLAKKWICDMVSGGSFYKKNREYFTKAESHFFLNTPPIKAPRLLWSFIFSRNSGPEISAKNKAPPLPVSSP
jgi:hypothetical protein